MTEPTTAVVDKKDSRADLIELFFVSFLSLFFELLFIRWMSADIRAFSIFKTFPLVACFIGLGIGCAQRTDRWFRWAPLMVFLSVAVIRFALPQFGLDQLLPANLASFNWFEPSNQGLQGWLSVTGPFMIFLPIVLALPFFTMACLGTRIGFLFSRLKPLSAYCADLLGALAGSISSSLVNFAGIDPAILLASAVVPAAALAVRSAPAKKTMTMLFAACAIGLCLMPVKMAPATWSYWTPYQHLQLNKLSSKDRQHHMYWLFVNGRSYQACWDRALEQDPLFNQFLIPYWSRCFMPYRLRSQPEDVLVVAAGMGMDIQAALTGGAQRIDAVDLDPVIMNLGKELNPNRPYASPKVRPYCDDARHFFMNTDHLYDAVVFSHLDSQTVLGQSSSVRLDNFVYTKESFQRALKLLKPDGLLIVCFNAKKDYFRDRMYWTMYEAAGYRPVLFKDPIDTANWSFFLVAGEPVRTGKFQLPAGLQSLAPLVAPRERTRILTDDWPYLYVQTLNIDWTYIVISAEILLIAVIAGRNVLFKQATAGRWQMFLLGSAFLLLELQSINRLALFYGTTWISSAIVINGVLLLVLLANLISIRWHSILLPRLGLLYGLLLASLALSYLMPLQIVDTLGWHGGRTLITFTTMLPIFFGGLIFPTSFKTHADSSTAFAFNLCGATLGALLEYQAHFTGVNSLVLLSIVLYGLSYIAYLKTPLLSRS